MLAKSKIKYIQSLGQKKFRQQERCFIAEGPKIVAEMLAARSSAILEVFALKNWISENNSFLRQIPGIEITEQELEKISQLSTANQVLAVVKQFEYDSMITTAGKITLALDTIQDPGNLGTIIRIADWFGVEQIVCSKDSADMYNPKVVQASMGSIARIKLFYTDLSNWLIKQGTIRIYATVLEGQEVNGIQKPGEGIILVGNESKGISPELLQLANVRISIPKKGNAESLNAAVATGIVLSHMV